MMPRAHEKEFTLTNPSNSPAERFSITPKTPNTQRQRFAFSRDDVHIGRQDPEGQIMSTRSIILSPFKKTPKAQDHKTITSLSKQKENFTRLDNYNEIEIDFSEYFSFKEEP